MIRFDFDWTVPLNQVTLVLLMMLLALQIWLLLKSGAQASPIRFRVRIALNLILWASMLAFVLQPYFRKNQASKTAMITGREVPQTEIRKLADSLSKAELINVDELNDHNFDTLIILGQDFQPYDFKLVTRIAKSANTKWIPYFQPDQFQSLNWKGIVRKGEMQVIRGSIETSEKQFLKVRFGEQILDSTLLAKGFNTFKLTFPTFGVGRNAMELILGNATIESFQFFARPSENLTVRFVLKNPDFESRNLATWLGKNGHSVIYDAVISKNTSSKLNINKAAIPDIILTDATNASSNVVKKAVSEGKSVLFMNLTEPASDINRINVALGTRFQVKKISNEASVSLGTQLSALPFAFTPNHYSLQIPKMPVAVEKTTGKIGVSLLNETFPLQLAGDSTRYQHVWNTILAFTRPPEKDRIEIEAPVLLGIPGTLEMNGFPGNPRFVRVGNDTVFLNYSALNSQSATGNFTASEAGWLALRDYRDVEVNVHENSSLASIEAMHHFVHSNERYHSKLAETKAGNTQSVNGIDRKLPGWFWFGLIMICFAAVWIEAKML